MGLPPVTYRLHRTREATISGGHRYIYTAREVTDRYAAYMLEALETSNEQITSTAFSRISEYPVACIQILLFEVEKQDGFTAYKSRHIHLRGLFNYPIMEYLDHAGRQPWSPRRFTYGPHRFV